MRLIMVRHGEPNYEKDCLTETGRQQAAAAAERLTREGITAVYASPMGRARETASFTAERLHLPVQVLDYMHEISWGGPDIPEHGHPWTLSDRMISEENYDFRMEAWREHPYFKGNAAVQYLDMIAEKIDGFLETLGYRHEGVRFLCGETTAGPGPAYCPTCWPCPSPMCARCCRMILRPSSSWNSPTARVNTFIPVWSCSTILPTSVGRGRGRRFRRSRIGSSVL